MRQLGNRRNSRESGELGSASLLWVPVSTREKKKPRVTLWSCMDWEYLLEAHRWASQSMATLNCAYLL